MKVVSDILEHMHTFVAGRRAFSIGGYSTRISLAANSASRCGLDAVRMCRARARIPLRSVLSTVLR